MRVLVVAAGHPDLAPGEGSTAAYALFAGLREGGAVEATLLASVDRTMPALFKPGAHITAFDGRPGEYLFLSHDVDPWWHRNGEPLLVEAFAAFLELIRPDAVHFHAFVSLGLELATLTRRVLPDCRIVFTPHDFMAICAADGSMVRRTDGSACDHATPVRCHQCFPDVPPERFFLRAAVVKAHLAAVDVVAVPREAMRDPFVRFGVPAEKVVPVPHEATEAMVADYLAMYAGMTGERAIRTPASCGPSTARSSA